MTAGPLRWLALCFGFAFIATLTGCGGSGSPGSGGTSFSGSTSVTLLASSTANDRLQLFNIAVTSLTLTSQSGENVTISAPSVQFPEFIHLNGAAEPLFSGTVPQGIYTSATANLGGAQFTCVELDPGTLNTNTYSYGQVPPNQVSVALASPITISGTAMGLALNLQVSKSASYATCDIGNPPQYSINPTFDLTPVTFAAQPSTVNNGQVTGLDGLITALGATGSTGTPVTVTMPDGPVEVVNLTRATGFQGVSGVSALTVGMGITFDANFQSDGSLLATRLAVADPSTANLSVVSGTVEFVDTAPLAIDMSPELEQGTLYEGIFGTGTTPFGYNGAAFHISPQITNLQSLPFTPVFTSANMVPGQRISLTSHAQTTSGGPNYTPMSTVTLIPQTIDGTISAVATSGSFTIYTVTLSSLDLFPQLAVQPNQANLLTAPNTVVVYTDENTQLLNTAAIATGSIARFTGAVFEDNGTLRMDCLQINDGVTP